MKQPPLTHSLTNGPGKQYHVLEGEAQLTDCVPHHHIDGVELLRRERETLGERDLLEVMPCSTSCVACSKQQVVLQYPLGCLSNQTRASFRGWGGGGGAFASPWKLCAPLGNFNPSKLHTAHYTHTPPKCPPACFYPPFGIFLNEPLQTAECFPSLVSRFSTRPLKNKSFTCPPQKIRF